MLNYTIGHITPSNLDHTKEFDHDSFLEDLNSVPWSLCDAFDDPNDALSCWQTLFLEVADNPVTECSVKKTSNQTGSVKI